MTLPVITEGTPGMAITLTVAVFDALMLVEQLKGEAPPLAILVTVTVVFPVLVRELVEKVPLPAVDTVIVAVLPVAALAPDKL